MIINKGNLTTLYVAFKTIFQNAFDGVESQRSLVAMEVPSTTGTEEYGWLGTIPNVREFVGDRVVHNLQLHDHSIKNKKFELTVAVPRDALEDDTYGIYNPMISEMGRSTAAHPDQLVFGLLEKGFETACYDGQYFFDADHPVLDEQGNEITVSNMQAGAGNPWFLVDNSRAIKPMIFQKRKDTEFTAMTKPEDEGVFSNDEYRYGTRARHNVGFGLWQLAYGSKAELNEANFDAAFDAMTSLRGDYDRPLGIKPRLLVVGASNRKKALQIVKAETIGGGNTNVNQGLVEVVVVPWLK